jgi:hypothetical protein
VNLATGGTQVMFNGAATTATGSNPPAATFAASSGSSFGEFAPQPFSITAMSIGPC